MLPQCLRGVLKKSEPCLEHHVVLPTSASLAVSGGINPGETAEIAREVRLVRVSTSDCQLRPSHFVALVQSAHRALKASHPAPLLGRKANVLTEDSVQAPFANAQGVCCFAHAERPERAQRLQNVATPLSS